MLLDFYNDIYCGNADIAEKRQMYNDKFNLTSLSGRYK